MTGSARKLTEREEIMQAMKTPPEEGYFVWDGKDEDDRPATEEALRAGIETARRGRGRPAGSGVKEQIAIRIDRDVLAAFRAGGAGWQTRMNDAFREWLREHPAA